MVQMKTSTVTPVPRLAQVWTSGGAGLGIGAARGAVLDVGATRGAGRGTGAVRGMATVSEVTVTEEGYSGAMA
jgi:hypothetical protein